MGEVDKSCPKFSVFDAICWKLLPSQLGCGGDYIWSFKHAWVSHNKVVIVETAINNSISPFLLAGIALIEVGGKDFSDWPVFIARSFIWRGSKLLDHKITITKNPMLTSMGAVSIQLRRAAETMGLDASTLNQKQLNELAIALQSDRTNLDIVAKHLRHLILIDYPSAPTNNLTDEQVRVVGTRYWWGPEKKSDFIKSEAGKASSYGSIILKHKKSIERLLQ